MLFFVATSISFSQHTIYSNDFELNNGGWTDGGGDCEFRSKFSCLVSVVEQTADSLTLMLSAREKIIFDFNWA